MPAGENHDGKRGRHAGITVNAAIPGFVKTNLNDGAHGGMAAMIRLSVKLIGISAAKGADTPLWVATAPELTGVTGKVFEKRKERAAKFTDPAPIAELERACDELAHVVG